MNPNAVIAWHPLALVQVNEKDEVHTSSAGLNLALKFDMILMKSIGPLSHV
jgi:hypothetical protein